MIGAGLRLGLGLWYRLVESVDALDEVRLRERMTTPLRCICVARYPSHPTTIHPGVTRMYDHAPLPLAIIYSVPFFLGGEYCG